MQDVKNIVIIGGGIIGATSAYFLSHHPNFDREKTTITMVEATKIAGGASGKAGGLLALWAYPSCIVPLSYRLHKELADKHNGAERWGYRAVHCGQVDAKGRPASKAAAAAGNGSGGDAVSLNKRSEHALGLLRAAGVPADLDWLVPGGVRAYDEMGDPSTTAQVHPYQFTTAMASLAEEAGVRIVLGSAASINRAASGSAVESVTYTANEDGSTHTLPADRIVLAAGPWTQRLLPTAPIEALRAHSVTIRTTRPVSAYALFTHISLPAGEGRRRGTTVTPEIYARPDGEVYACGEGDHLVPLPATTALVGVDDGRCQAIIDQVGAISDELRSGEVTARQACYLPNVAGGGGPLVGESGVEGLVVAAGHTCWGIQNGPGTGKCVAELVWEGKIKSAKLDSLDPRRYK